MKGYNLKTDEDVEKYIDDKWLEDLENEQQHDILMRTLCISAIYKYHMGRMEYDVDMKKYDNMTFEELTSLTKKLNLVIKLSR